MGEQRSYIGKKNQNYIAVAIDSQQSSPSQAQAKRMRELDEKKLLNGDVIDGIKRRRVYHYEYPFNR